MSLTRSDASHADDRLMRVALRAYPPRWHRRHAVGAIEDPDLGRGLPGAINVVNQGLRYRREDRPPLGVRLGGRVPDAKWHDWYRDWTMASRLARWLRRVPDFFSVAIIQVAASVVLNRSLDVPQTQPIFLATITALFVVISLVALIFIRFTHETFTADRRAELLFRLQYDPFAGELPNGQWIPSWPEVDPSGYKVAALRDFGFPVGIWATVAGAALLGGAAWPNDSEMVVGPLRYMPDPNAPLTARAVGVWGAALALTAAAIEVALILYWRRRAGSANDPPAQPAGPSWSPAKNWGFATLVGLPPTALGLSGVLPDQGCAVVGTVLVILGTSLLVTRLVKPSWVESTTAAMST